MGFVMFSPIKKFALLERTHDKINGIKKAADNHNKFWCQILIFRELPSHFIHFEMVHYCSLYKEILIKICWKFDVACLLGLQDNIS